MRDQELISPSGPEVSENSLVQPPPAPVREPTEVGNDEIKPEILERISGDRVATVVQDFAHEVESWAGPTPPLEYLQGFEKLVPGAAERFLKTFENENEDRRSRIKEVSEAAVGQAKRGQLMAFILALAFLLVSAFLIYTGHELSGTIMGSLDIVALVAIFITGTRQIHERPDSEISQPNRQSRG